MTITSRGMAKTRPFITPSIWYPSSRTYDKYNRIPHSVNKHVPSATYVVKSHLPSILKTPKSPLIYLRKGGGACRLLFSLIKIQASIIEIRHIAGKAKNTEYQTIRPKSDPMIGDKTFPSPFDASTIPRIRSEERRVGKGCSGR